MKTIKLLTAAGAFFALGAGFVWADGSDMGPCPDKPYCGKLQAPDCNLLPCDDIDPFCGPAEFMAKGCETRRITIGGNIAVGYQYVDVNDDVNEYNDSDEYNNFLMKHIRLNVKAELGNGWSGFMSIDFAGKSGRKFGDYDEASAATAGALIERSCACEDQCKLYVDRAYIQKVWLDATFRFGHQKVNWGAEQNTPEPHLKAIERSVATNFFTNLGRRANSGAHRDTTNTTRDLTWVGQGFGDRHTGIFLAGQAGAFHYSGALVNGYQGICMNSDQFNNQLGFFASVAFEFGIDEIDFLMGVNGGFKPKGSNALSTVNKNVYGVNPYVFANWCRLSVMGEFFWGSVEDGKITASTGDSNPWGFNLIPSYMLNDCWELVGRFSYVNSDEMGMTIHDTFGCAPDNAKLSGGTNPTFVASDQLFEKVYAGYLGVNYYMMNGAVKVSLGIEQAKFKNRYSMAAINSGTFGDANNKGAKVNAARACMQFLF